MAFSNGWRTAPLDRLATMDPTRVPITEERLRKAKLPQRFWNAKIPSLPEGAMKETLTRYVQKGEQMTEKGIGLLLHGGSPSGRTWCASIGLRWAIGCGLSALFVDSTQMKSAQIEDHELAARLGAVEFLLIDNLGKGHRATEEHARETFGELLRVRTGAQRLTWITVAIPPQADPAAAGAPSLEFSFPDEFATIRETMIPIRCDVTPPDADPVSLL